MAATVITRATWTDDNGSGTTGTIIDNARKNADVYDKVDQMFAGGAGYTTFTFGGHVAIPAAKKLFVGGTANAKQTTGLTIDQLAADDEAISLKSSLDVAHGITNQTETDTYGMFKKFHGANGGLRVEGYSEGNVGLDLGGMITAIDTTRSVLAEGACRINGYLKSGTSLTVLGANGNILTVSNGGTGGTRFILDGDGDSHQDVGTAWTNFDTHDDVALMDALAVTVARPGDPLREAFVESIGRMRATLEAVPGKPFVQFNDDGHHFVNMSRVTMLHHGAIRQIGQQLAALCQHLGLPANHGVRLLGA
jgi:hypothetical protein